MKQASEEARFHRPRERECISVSYRTGAEGLSLFHKENMTQSPLFRNTRAWANQTAHRWRQAQEATQVSHRRPRQVLRRDGQSCSQQQLRGDAAQAPSEEQISSAA